jgi:hypothetical protein
VDEGEHRQAKTIAACEARPEWLAVGLDEPIVPIYDRRQPAEPVMRFLPGIFFKNLYIISGILRLAEFYLQKK